MAAFQKFLTAKRKPKNKRGRKIILHIMGDKGKPCNKCHYKREKLPAYHGN